jgi:VanZ family protein
MKNILTRSPIRVLVLLAWGLFVVVLTTQTSRVPLVGLMTSTIGSTVLGATLGHAGLFGVLAGVGYLGLSLRLRRRYALLLAVVVSLLLGTITEFYQFTVAGRSPDLSDLLANWLGVFAVAFAISYLVLLASAADV